MTLTTTVCEDHRAPQTSSSACPGAGHIRLRVASVSRSGTMQPLSPLGLGVPHPFCPCSFTTLDPAQLNGPTPSTARTPTTPQCVSKPAPPGMTRGTISASAPCILAHGRQVCISVTGSFPWLLRPLGLSCTPPGARSQGTRMPLHAQAIETDWPQSDDRPCDPMSSPVCDR